jgi:two-component system nitrate/nitrite response regulator NarL
MFAREPADRLAVTRTAEMPAKAITKVRPYDVLIADDDPLVRAAVGALLSGEQRFRLAGEAKDGMEAIEMARALSPDVLLLDLKMPGKAGLEALRDLATALPQMRTIVLTVGIEKREILEALQLGARGIVLKSAARNVLPSAMTAVLDSSYWVNDHAVKDVKAIVRDLAAQMKSDPVTAKKNLLSPKEMQIVTFIVEGRTNKDIAGALQTSEQVVKNHLGKIFDKLGVFNRLELALYALDNRLVERA